MPWVRSGVANVEIDGAIRAAIRSLSYFDPRAEAELAQLIADDWPAFCSGARHLRKHPELFNEAGREQMTAAIAAIRGFISFAVWKTVFDGSEHIWGEYCATVELRASVKACCSASRRLDGLVWPRSDRPELPLSECDAEWCSCRWLQNTDGL